MIDTIIAALLPIVVTLFLGFFAGWHRDFDATQGAMLNRMVMLYALPLTLFAGIMSISREVLLAQWVMGLLLLIGMLGAYLLTFFISHFIFKRPTPIAALQAISISAPAAPFVGIPVLGHLFGSVSTIPIAFSSIVLNLIISPITLMILANYTTKTANKNATTAPSVSAKNQLLKNLINTIKEPMVWAPVAAFIALLCDVRLSAAIESSLQLLGNATGGVSLFACGVILFSFKVTFNKTIAISVICKNIILPICVFAVGLLIHTAPSALNMTVITVAIPTASIGIILAVQFNLAQQEMASTLFFSTLLSIITMGGFIYYLH